MLAGQISVCGALLDEQNDPILIVSPKNLPLPVLQAASIASPLSESLQPLFDNGSTCGAIVKFCDASNSNLQNISSVCHLIRSDTYTLSPSPIEWPIPGMHPVTGTRLLGAQCPRTWMRQLDDLPTQHSIYLLRGPKRTGKTTFCRYLLNRLLTTTQSPVCYLETDVGQAEFGPPGMIALHYFDPSTKEGGASPLVIGPNYASLRHPVRGHFLGDISPKDISRQYMDAIFDLVSAYKRDFQPRGISLIVNTHGWNKGLGNDLIRNVQLLVSPVHTLEMVEEADIPTSNEDHSDAPVFLEAAPSLLTRDQGLNAAESRVVNLVSYFYSMRLPLPCSNLSYQSGLSCPAWSFSTPLVNQAPFLVDVQQGLQGGLHILNLGACVEPRNHLLALNGSCVGIVITDLAGISEQDNFQPLQSTDAHTQSSYSFKQALQRPLPSWTQSSCVGLAVVRSIDVAAGKVHLLCNLDAQLLRDRLQRCEITRPAIALVKGSIELPTWLSLDDAMLSSMSSNSRSLPTQLAGVPLSSVPYLDFSSCMSSTFVEQKDATFVGTGKRRIRRNLLRPSQNRPRA